MSQYFVEENISMLAEMVFLFCDFLVIQAIVFAILPAYCPVMSSFH
jgi:hypothetical protein